MLALRRFLFALLTTALAFGVYALLVAPWLEPPAVKATQVKSGRDQHTSTVDLRDFSELFADGSWELDDPKVIETAQCTLLLKDYKPLPDGQMEIKPCTIIFYMAAGQEATTAAKKAATTTSA